MEGNKNTEVKSKGGRERKVTGMEKKNLCSFQEVMNGDFSVPFRLRVVEREGHVVMP